jgi:hypothetical protein
VIAYRATLDVPRELVAYLTGLLRAERRTRGTRRKARALTCFRQALFALVWFRKREDLTVLGAGFGISRATAYRYRDEAVAVLAAQAPELTEALQRVQHEGWSHVILDGKIIDTDRCRAKTTSRGLSVALTAARWSGRLRPHAADSAHCRTGSFSLGVHRISLPTGCDRVGGALVPAIRAVVPRRRGAACGARHRR